MSVLRIHDLRVRVAGKQILNGIDLEVSSGEVHAIMGPNGSGKSTLSNALMGHPDYEVTGGSITLDGEELLGLPTHVRAVRPVEPCAADLMQCVGPPLPGGAGVVGRAG